MIFDYKKEYKEFYFPALKPQIIVIPPMNFIAVSGKGDPNDVGGEYKQSVGLLYGVAYTLKMSYRAGHRIDGFFDYVVPPLEGFWWIPGIDGVDYSRKSDFRWISIIRLPDFVIPSEVSWAKAEATEKKKIDFSKVDFLHYEEGLVVQCLHAGSYDSESATVKMMQDYDKDKGYAEDFSSRFHHEIYLSDARKTEVGKMRTIIRHPLTKSVK
jgi:hypothetical protein